jgi:polysaccharide biosynthesis/export protein
MIRTLAAGVAVLALASCESTLRSDLPSGAAAYEVAPPADPNAAPAPRLLRQGDTIRVQVFREPDLSVEKLLIDEFGVIQLPLAGEVVARGRTPAELSKAIAERLGARYLRDPQVSVLLLESGLQTVSVEGQVVEPGTFPVTPNSTLLSTLAQAKSPTRLAKLDEVVVFRTTNGRRVGGRFNIDDIRAGRAPDPQILDGDVIVVGFSSLKGAYRDFLQAAPLLNVFTVF